MSMSNHRGRGRESEEMMASQTKLTQPEEDQFYKYRVLRIPVARRSEQLIIGVEKAKAIVLWFDEIKAFVNKHDGKDAA